MEDQSVPAGGLKRNRFPRDVEFGVHRPCCGGRCLRAHTGTDNFIPFTLALICAPCGTYFSLLAVQEMRRVSIALPIVVGTFTFFSLLFLMLAWLTEPGILPTHTFEDRTDPSRPRIRTHVVVDGQRYELAAFRAKFSRFTDSCIEHFDHYCPWIGNAVGKRNYRWFFFFVTSVLFLAGSMCAACSTDVVLQYLKKKGGETLGNVVKDNLVSVILAVYGLLLFFSLLSLWFFHVRAICANVTTNEYLKNTYKGKHNPSDLGAWRNCRNFLCGPCSHRSYVCGPDANNNPLINPLAGDGRHDVGEPMRGIATPSGGSTLPRSPDLSQSFPSERGLMSAMADDDEIGGDAKAMERRLSSSMNAISPWLSVPKR